MPGGLDHLQRLRAYRGRRERDDSIVGLVQRIATDASTTQRKLGRFIDLWERLVPRDLASRSRVIAMRRGVVSIAVDSSSTMYELDRMLRGGLEQDLRREFQSAVVRVRLSVGDVLPPPSQREGSETDAATQGPRPRMT
jgi:hypothetical protein